MWSCRWHTLGGECARVGRVRQHHQRQARRQGLSAASTTNLYSLEVGRVSRGHLADNCQSWRRIPISSLFCPGGAHGGVFCQEPSDVRHDQAGSAVEQWDQAVHQGNVCH